MRSRTAIECRSLAKVYGRRSVVDDVSFTVEEGSITGFVGANGAGKTTTLRMLLGLVEPTNGEATIFGRPYRELDSPRSVIGAVVDGPGAHPGHSARTHLEIVAAAAGLPRQRVTEVLQEVDLADHATRRVGGFSLGMRQRLALATALLGDPRVLVLDEPVNGLDPPGILWVRDVLRRAAGEGRAVLVSSHLLQELAEVADHIVIIDQGRLVADAPLQDLLRDRAPSVVLRCADGARARRALEAAGTRVESQGDQLVVHGLAALDVGEIVAAARAGPVHLLAERASSFEDVYFELAGVPSPATTSNGGRA